MPAPPDAKKDDRPRLTIRVDRQRHRDARIRMIDDGLNFQQLFDQALDAYLDPDAIAKQSVGELTCERGHPVDSVCPCGAEWAA